jgi:hypothetical protein
MPKAEAADAAIISLEIHSRSRSKIGLERLWCVTEDGAEINYE